MTVRYAQWATDPFQLTVHGPKFDNDAVKFINQVGQLSYGTLKKNLFVEHFDLRKKFLLDIVSKKSFDKFEIQNLGFNLYMLEQAGKSLWRLPGTITDNVVNSGNSRIFSTSLVYKQPWNRVFFLALHTTTDPTEIFESYKNIRSSDDLHKVFDLNQVNEFPEIELDLAFVKSHNLFSLQFRSVREITDSTDHDTVGLPYFDRFESWIKRYQQRPQILIRTNSVERIKNTNDFWDIVSVESIDEIKRTITKPGHIERAIYMWHFNRTGSSPEYVLDIIDDDAIDISELIFWQDNNHNVYIDKDFRFVLYRSEDFYQSKMISLSRL